MTSRRETLMERARQAAGLDEFGEGSFVDGLERLVSAYDHEADLTVAGAAALDDQIVDLLCRRLEVEQCYLAHPEINDERIASPLIGLGLPRTGSTAFQYLLSEDPGVRYTRHWEMYQPCPPPESATEHTDPRIEGSQKILDFSFALFPKLKLMLPTSPKGPVECQQIMGHDFKSLAFPASARLPSYSKWLLYEADLVPTFTYLKRVLKLLQWHCPPKRWRLKNPNHCLFLTALNEVFPDARFWMTHRDPSHVLLSVCNLYEELMHSFTHGVDRLHIARANLEWTELGMRRVMEFRDGGGQDGRFFDVQFEEFQREPLHSIERLYAFLGEPLTATARINMERWWQQSLQEKGAPVQYQSEGFDLDEAMLDRRYADYRRRFKVAGRSAGGN